VNIQGVPLATEPGIS